MYGFVNHALELLVVRNFGEEKWEEIKKKVQLNIEGHFLQRIVYNDDITYSLVGAASEVLGIEPATILEKFGELFFDFCQESGYDRILQVLGGTLRDFICNLDALHDHLGAIYPGMQAPSFRVSDRESDGALILHYYSKRDGLEPIVVGIVKTVARKLLDTEISVEIYKAKEFKGDHVQFVIKEIDRRDNRCQLQVKSFDPIRDSFHLSNEPKISPATFCTAFPFHLMFDRNLKITQAGSAVRRIVVDLNEDRDVTITQIFELIRPQMNFAFDSILAHINTVFVLKSCEGKIITPENNNNVNNHINNANDNNDMDDFDNDFDSQSNHQTHQSHVGNFNEIVSLRLKGQMVYIAESESMLFLCSPSLGNLDDLRSLGLFLSDIPIHDATKDLILLSEQFKAEYVLTQELEILNDKLRQTHNALAEKKQLTDQLLYSVLPPSVANELRHKRPVQSEKVEMVTLLFSGIVDFATVCKNSKPMDIVLLLSNIYTNFDMLTDPAINDVYKVETVGDKYMAVSGLPEKCSWHARSVCKMALDMITVIHQIKHKGENVEIRIGIHSGEVVAGVLGHKTPRYCLFGNTVNLTSRTETTGAPNKVNITEFTYSCLQEPVCHDPSFVFEKRGPVHMKGRVKPMITYFLTRDPKYEPRIPVSNITESNSFNQWNVQTNDTSIYIDCPAQSSNNSVGMCPFAVSEVPSFHKLVTQV